MVVKFCLFGGGTIDKTLIQYQHFHQAENLRPIYHHSTDDLIWDIRLSLTKLNRSDTIVPLLSAFIATSSLDTAFFKKLQIMDLTPVVARSSFKQWIYGPSVFY